MMSKSGMILNRETVCAMLPAALAGAEHRFARQLALAWLSAFPGDLEVAYFQAQAIVAEGRPALAVTALEQLVRKDPEFQAAHQALADLTKGADEDHCMQANAHVFALGGRAAPGCVLPAWAQPLQLALHALRAAQWEPAERLVQDALRAAPDLLLPAVAHLKLTRATQPPTTTLRLAEVYHNRWPDCLPVNLILAETRMELGQEQDAVRLLHQCVSNDASGQAARRLWGANHPYRSLWLDDMVIVFERAVPAGVAARLGWNQLDTGIAKAAAPAPARAPQPVKIDPPAAAARPQPASQPPDVAEEFAPFPEDGELPELPLDDLLPETGAEPSPAGEAVQSPAPQKSAQQAKRRDIGALHQVENEFERLAKKLRKSGPGQVDARFPVYVIFTTHGGLVDKYGPQTTSVIDLDLRRLAGIIRQRAGWDALVYYPDVEECASQFGLDLLAERDPWKLKLALADLDKALARRGEMIGALLIVGGDEIVPFHRLPNPTDDNDRDVPSDNPYGTRDSNYFVTEWPVGRLPTEPGPDAGSLLEKLRRLQKYHTRAAAKRAPLPGFGWISSVWNRILGKNGHRSLGYSAAVWRRSSLAVFRPIGAPHTVVTSPPEQAGSAARQRVTQGSLGYYNLHGTEDSSAWYGQRDPADQEDGPDYPVALLPEDLKDLQRNGHAPRVVFSEACYGGHVFGKNDNQSLAMKFLSVGTQAVVASTCVSYGSINTPLIAADLLGNLFWRHLKAGRTVGDSVSQARIDLTREMNRRQGYLDGEDQKTLISFVLYGDPLATYNGFRSVRKSVQRPKNQPAPKTMCDRAEAGEEPPAVSHEVLKQVKRMVAEYLPGAELGDVHLSRQHASCAGAGHHCPTADLGSRKKAGPEVGRLVVTMSKQVSVAQHLHRHYVRITLDEGGKPVKMAISR